VSRYYAGIGSRETPQDILKVMQTVGRMLAARGWVLRSGHADGADMAFERGCDQMGGEKEIYLPWYRFNGSSSRLHKIPDWAFEQASEIHPNWQYLKAPVKKLHARNILQIMGPSEDSPLVEVVLCWTPDGRAIGGTATALALAATLSIDIVNMASEGHEKELRKWCPGL
jgi:hypothetical protein